ncbi:MAG: DUF523 and DUF1722 domain-containing protein [Endomicrobiia bacterium]
MKPTIIISACLNNKQVRYNGTNANDEIVNKIKNLFELTDVCPEVSVGLGIPRKPIRLNKLNNEFKVIQEETGLDLTEKLKKFSYETVNTYKDKICAAILKARSPSCGVGNCKYYINNKIYGKTYGVFARIIKEELPYLPLTDEGRLRNVELKWEFLTKTFLLFRFKSLNKDINSFLEFHTKNKYILMGLSQKHLRILGRILASYKKISSEEIFRNYEITFKEMLSLNFKRKNLANALIHIFGHISKNLSRKEKENFLKIVDKYKNNNLDISVATEMLKIYVLRFNDNYLLMQNFFEPFPEI